MTSSKSPAGIIFQGSVTGAKVSGNSISTGLSAQGQLALLIKNGGNANNNYQGNKISGAFGATEVDPGQNCLYGNVTQLGGVYGPLPNNRSTPCFR